MVGKFLLLALFGIAMAHVEGVGVVYLRKVLGIGDLESNNVGPKRFSKQYLFIEKTREVATIVMLVTLALLVGSTWADKAIVFLKILSILGLVFSFRIFITQIVISVMK
ncbi:hypothetical protein KAX97_11565 [candidate division WOR-3 bacterium]|nr:hypothetical protein [candidate division WOR-3 bacterium]